MTAKEALREAINGLSETEAAAWLARIEASQRELHAVDDERTDHRPINVVIAELMARIPAEEWAKAPPPADIDEVVYGDPHGRRSRR